MAMIATGFRFVIVLFTLNVHQIQLIDQAMFLEQRNRSIDRGSIDFRILFLAIPSSVATSRCRGES